MTKGHEKNFHLALLCMRKDSEKGDTISDVKLCTERGFQQCEYLHHSTRSDREENLMLVVEFFTHQRAYDFSQEFFVVLDNQPCRVPVRAVRYEREANGVGYTYIVKLQGNTKKWQESK
jgi:hypothetical protein